ncbi:MULTISPECIES: hypothetical protein [Aminobacter]|jgi:hypothetical protein|uniref:Uncharacterized protein n=2 Tax=Aminobacter TaxID=31988 RepID=A0AAC9ARA7_AMIAI|nr:MULTISPECIES: hypothetical protein [Aminobacter]AMS41597.1 hypothetical protein AA2016_2672 [Aminobacter aminovorans]MBA8904343.1 hypothetical protein [Aminobacter ciceronei]MBA9018121.1 hypothetical protein [Aminobacter ciceronei]MBB3704054.1 hypothetical protein [Aminobacter aminovorans]MRX33293.1 hypothetical protein [Aminobacter sp. MDW-2]
MKTLEMTITAIVAGDLSGIPVLKAASHADLLDAAARLPQLTIARPALAKVLKSWRSGHCSADVVQQWASFARRGYIAGGVRGAVRPIDIEYDALDENLIVEVIGRLDEIGDIIDGEVDDNEREAMLRILEA